MAYMHMARHVIWYYWVKRSRSRNTYGLNIPQLNIGTERGKLSGRTHLTAGW